MPDEAGNEEPPPEVPNRVDEPDTLSEADGPLDDDLDKLIPEATSLGEAQAEAHELLKIVEITRVICVDDDFEGTVEDLRAACEDLAPEATISCFEAVSFDVPPEVWGPAIDARWADLSPTERGVALADAKEKAGHLDTEQLNAGALWTVLPAEVEFVALTPTDWVGNEATYIGEAIEKPTLVLFDKELGGGLDGLALVITLYAADTEKRMWAGLFTHTTDIASEHAVWTAHANTPGVESDRFIVLSKQHMGPDPRTFPQALKVALMTRPSSVLRRAVSVAIRNQMDQALAALDGLSPAEFERLVFGLTREEGQWEVDMLLRLFDALLRTEVRRALHDNSDVRAGIRMLRMLADATTLRTEDTTHAQRIYRRELYEEGDHLNSLNLPLELGDIFRTTNGRSFILVLQPCDLMVRSDGDRHPDLQHAGLIEIRDNDPNTPAEPAEGDASPPLARRKEAHATFELPAFKDGNSAWAWLDRAYMVPIEALDYCVFDPSGKSLAPTVGGAPDWLLPGWARRHRKLATAAAAITAAITPLNNTVSSENRRRIAASHFGRIRGVAKISLTDANAVTFDLQRVARLRHPHARALLTRFTAHVARDAFERAII